MLAFIGYVSHNLIYVIVTSVIEVLVFWKCATILHCAKGHSYLLLQNILGKHTLFLVHY
jgi:hypothetical protein